MKPSFMGGFFFTKKDPLFRKGLCINRLRVLLVLFFRLFSDQEGSEQSRASKEECTGKIG